MKRPQGNKIQKGQPIEGKVEDNAKQLEELYNQTDWVKAGKAYAIGLAIFLVTLFSTVAIIRLALKI